jgi:hypothetical protein
MNRLLAAVCAAVTAIALSFAPARADQVGTAPGTGFALVDGNWLNGLARGANQAFQNGLTAHAGGGQSAALALGTTATLFEVDTVASTNDSVALPFCVAPLAVTVVNNGANTLALYASSSTNGATATTDKINGAANTTPYAIAANAWATFACVKNGVWQTVSYPASGLAVGTTDTQTLTNKTLTSPTISGPTLSGTVAGTLTFSGADTFSSTLAITGATTPTGGVAAAGGFTISPRTFGTCGTNGTTVAATSAFTNQTPVATEFYIAEIFVPANVTVTGVAVLNGSAVSGNLKVGLANSSGVNVATSASTAASGTTAYQLVPFTTPYAAVGPATYFVTTFYDNTTQRATAFTTGSCATAKATAQVFATGFTTFVAPTTFTTAIGPVANLY